MPIPKNSIGSDETRSVSWGLLFPTIIYRNLHHNEIWSEITRAMSVQSTKLISTKYDTSPSTSVRCWTNKEVEYSPRRTMLWKITKCRDDTSTNQDLEELQQPESEAKSASCNLQPQLKCQARTTSRKTVVGVNQEIVVECEWTKQQFETFPRGQCNERLTVSRVARLCKEIFFGWPENVVAIEVPTVDSSFFYSKERLWRICRWPWGPRKPWLCSCPIFFFNLPIRLITV